MLDRFFGAAAAKSLRTCPLGDHVERFCTGLAGLGYRPGTIRVKLWWIGVFARWMAESHLTIADLDDQRVNDFIAVRQREREGSQHSFGLRKTLLTLLEQVRGAGGLVLVEPIGPGSPTSALLMRYEQYLRRERSLAESTVTHYLVFARAFVLEHLKADALGIEHLKSESVRDFLLARVRRVAPKHAQLMATALRCFLRFLFLRGDSSTNLALAVPRVQQLRHSAPPRFISPEDVERVLRACDISSAAGRRDHAVLMLLARLGLRASEVLSLELEDLRWREGEVIVRGKGLIRDRLPLLPDVGRAIALYLKSDRPAGATRRVFLCNHAPFRGFSHPSTVSTIVLRALTRAGLRPATCGAHVFRHSLATAMVRRGASLAEIGQVLRHRSPNTTEIYAKLDFDALRDVAMPWPVRGAL